MVRASTRSVVSLLAFSFHIGTIISIFQFTEQAPAHFHDSGTRNGGSSALFPNSRIKMELEEDDPSPHLEASISYCCERTPTVTHRAGRDRADICCRTRHTGD
ncbi:hypothetical protein FA15DRAFT_326025 [Coprinopsis marcescibilis]|uniref:Uncharacterized protein n=1 Tax=Coprinopsis marcescibilis TaxID=230819 RepID=A0A5C3KZ79_COPMA|nr:hypothetical protein FA15DRAFT_326025 [Coprinopsis marcescibilis]